MVNTIQNMLIGVVLFGLLINLGYSAFTYFISDYGVISSTNLSEYVYIDNLDADIQAFNDQVSTGGSSILTSLEIFFNGAWDVIQSITSTVPLINGILGTISGVLHLPYIIPVALGLIVSIVILFVIIRALTKQDQT